MNFKRIFKQVECTMWKREKMVVTNNFSISPRMFLKALFPRVVKFLNCARKGAMLFYTAFIFISIIQSKQFTYPFLKQNISPLPTVFSKDLYCRHVKTRACLENRYSYMSRHLPYQYGTLKYFPEGHCHKKSGALKED